MTVPSTSLLVDRYVLASAVLLTCVLFTSLAADPVNVIKLTALLLCAVALLASASYRAIRYRTAQVPAGPAGWVAALLALGLVVSALVAPVTSTAVLGAYGRNSGLLAYGAALVLFVGALRVVQRPHTAVLLGGIVLAGLFTATYGLLQKAGIDAIPWNNPFNPIIAALGNPNFASGYLGIAASVGAGGAAWRGWAYGWRLASGVTALLCLLTASLSASVQGPIAAAAGLFVVALGLILNLRHNLRRAGLAAAGGVALVGVAALVTGALAQAGPAAAIFSDIGSRARVVYWQAALEMFRERPVFGVGLDQYGNFWRTARSPESVELLGGPSFSDAAHSVPLQVLAQGGILLALAYTAFVGVAGFALVRGLLRLEGRDRILLAAVGGGWAAYQVQSFVSIDQVPLLVLHFTLAGAVVAVAGMSGLREVRLPGAPKPVTISPHDRRTRKRVAPAAPVARDLTGVDLTMLSGVALAALVAAWASFIPLRANVAAHEGDEQLARGEGNPALAAYERATGLVPGQSVYWTRTGSLYDQVSQPALARGAYEAAVRHDPYDVGALRAAAAAAETAGDLDRARTLFDRAVDLDPLNDETLLPAAAFELRHSGAEKARSLLEQAVRRLPWEAGLWATLGDARAVLEDPVEARKAYERALAIDPAQQVAKDGLAKLGTPSA